MAEKELTPMEAFDILTAGTNNPVAVGLARMVGKDEWLRASVVIKQALEERDSLKHKLIDIEFQNTLYHQSCESKDRKIAELKDSINDFNEALNKLQKSISEEFKEKDNLSDNKSESVEAIEKSLLKYDGEISSAQIDRLYENYTAYIDKAIIGFIK